MKRIFPALFILITVNSFASDWIINPDSSFHHSIGFSTEYFFASNAITNRFAIGYFRGEFIDDARKNSVSKNLSPHNRFGSGFNTEIKFARLNKTIFNLPHSFYSVSLGNHYYINSTFKKDVFELYFRGNKSYAGKTADLGKFKYNQVIYQQLNFTFGHNFMGNENNFGYSAGLSFNKGQKLYKISASRASLFTEKNGEYLDLDANLKIHQSDSTKHDINDWNGTGCSADFSFFWNDQKNNKLKLTAVNFGFINWNNNTAHVVADTSLRFEGVDVAKLFLLSDSIKESISLDSSLVEPYLSAREKKSYLSPLPALLSLSYQYILKPGKMDLEAEINYLFFASYTLHESVAFSYTIKNIHRLSLKTTYGGYTGFQAGLAYSTLFLKNWMFTVQSDYLSSLVNPDKGHAQGAFVSLTAYF